MGTDSEYFRSLYLASPQLVNVLSKYSKWLVTFLQVEEEPEEPEDAAEEAEQDEEEEVDADAEAEDSETQKVRSQV